MQSAGFADVQGPVPPFLVQVKLPQQVSDIVQPRSAPMHASGGTPQEQEVEPASQGNTASNTLVKHPSPAQHSPPPAVQY